MSARKGAVLQQVDGTTVALDATLSPDDQSAVDTGTSLTENDRQVKAAILARYAYVDEDVRTWSCLLFECKRVR